MQEQLPRIHPRSFSRHPCLLNLCRNSPAQKFKLAAFLKTVEHSYLTEDLYLLSLSDQGALSYRKTHINPIVILKEDLNALQPEFNTKNIRLSWIKELTGKISIYADPDRITQLFRNLLKNSAKYTHENGQLTVTELWLRTDSPGREEVCLP